MLVDRIKYLLAPKVKLPFPVFFMHIPKTGGTTLRHKLTLKFPDSQVYPNQELMRKFGDRYPRYHELGDEDYRCMQLARLVIGHYPIILKNKLPEDCKAITFFRDPVQRAISNLFHIYIHGKSNTNSLEEVFEHHSKTICNYQTRQMSGHWSIPEIGDESLEAAIHNLELIDCVCLTEQFDASLDKIGSLLHINMGRNIIMNKHSLKKSAVAPELMERIVSNNSLDQALYDLATKKF